MFAGVALLREVFMSGCPSRVNATVPSSAAKMGTPIAWAAKPRIFVSIPSWPS